MDFTYWFIVAGVLLTLIALAGSVLKQLPLSVALLYLGVGVLVGPFGMGLLVIDPLTESPVVERLAEVAVILSLFSAGLKMRLSFADPRWRLPLRLAFVSMAATVGLVALAGVFGLGLPLGGAILLGAVLAPTDPVLASDVEVEAPDDNDRLRFSLTGEAGFNDGTAFPFVMLGLGLLGLHELGERGLRWVLVDVLWAVPGGLAIGALLGVLMGRLVIYFRREHREAVGLDDFLALGLVLLAYGAALLVHTYAFLAAFAAGLALRWVERRYSDQEEVSDEVLAAAQQGEKEEMAVDQEKAPAYMASAVLGFSEQFERIGAVALVVLVGALLSPDLLTWSALWFVPLMLFVIRPLAVWIGLLGSKVHLVQRLLISWFGIRGIGSVYYLMYAENHGLPDGVARPILALVLITIAVSVIVHGTSVTPFMAWYRRRTDVTDETSAVS
ncbi:MAG: cation:proton antiporter [Rhodothermales bacterium]